MADESLLDQAIGMIPGMATKKTAQLKPSPQKQLAMIQKALAVLTKDVEKLAVLIAGKTASPKTTASASRKPTPAAKATRTARRAKPKGR